MNPKLVLLVLVILCAVLSWWGLHRALGGIKHPDVRTAARALLPLVLGGSTALLIRFPIGRTYISMCSTCGMWGERTFLLWFPRATSEPVKGPTQFSAYSDLFSALFGADCDHDWCVLSVHSNGLLGEEIACGGPPFESWYRLLPRVPQTIARGLLVKFRDAQGGERDQLIARLIGAPWDALASNGVEISREQFLREHASWLASHPEWQ
jgi:hypothetical protein